jgi:uncharacterized membrane protein YqaE (UPF0057 family)
MVEKDCLTILAVVFPALCVYFVTGRCGSEVAIAILLTFLFWIPGIIYAFHIMSKAEVDNRGTASRSHR